MRKIITCRALVILMSTAGLLSIQSCGDLNTEHLLRVDLAGASMPFDRPKLEPLLALPGSPELPESTQTILNLRRAFFAHEFVQLDAALLKIHESYLDGLGDYSVANRFIASMRDTQLAGIDACADWLAATPDSYPAHWICGAMWQNGAWAARGEQYANAVSDAQFAIMHERLLSSNELLVSALALHPKPLQALTMLADNNYLGGERVQAELYLEQAERIKSQHLAIHDIRMNYSLSEWGGSPEMTQAAFERAQALGVSQADLMFLNDQHIVRPGRMSNPGAARAYWEKAIVQNATRKRLSNLLDDFVFLENWKEALPVANRLIETFPDEESAYCRRAIINQRLGRIREAERDYRMAAAMGNEYALQELIMALIKGGLGITGKSESAIVALCRYGATLGSSVGANCIASLSFGGPGTEGVPYPKDSGQALAWHLLGARAGHYNSQYDLGWLLYTGRGAGMEATAANHVGIFWMRRAAEQGHQFATRKLEENNISVTEEVQKEMAIWYVKTILSELRRTTHSQ